MTSGGRLRWAVRYCTGSKSSAATSAPSSVALQRVSHAVGWWPSCAALGNTLIAIISTLITFISTLIAIISTLITFISTLITVISALIAIISTLITFISTPITFICTLTLQYRSLSSICAPMCTPHHATPRSGAEWEGRPKWEKPWPKWEWERPWPKWEWRPMWERPWA